jgi:hypothetical protein
MGINEQKAAALASISIFWAKFRYYVIGGAALIIVIVGLVFLGQWYATGQANALAEKLKAQFHQENQALYDNLAVLKDRTQQLEYKYGVQRDEITGIKNKLRGTTTNVFQSGDKKVIAGFFDNTVDNYIPSN